MKNLLPRIVLLLALVMLISGTALSLDPEEELEPAVEEEAPKISVAPPIDTIVTRYGRIVGKEGEGLVEGYKPTIAAKDFVVTGPHWLVPQVVYDVFMRG